MESLWRLPRFSLCMVVVKRGPGGPEGRSNNRHTVQSSGEIKEDLRVLKTRSANLNLLWKGYLSDEKDELAKSSLRCVGGAQGQRIDTVKSP